MPLVIHTEMHSALYVGHVSHRRFTPTPHAFDYRLFMVYLDLDELPRSLDGVVGWSARRPALAEFRRSDHFGDPRESLRGSIEGLLIERGVTPPGGPIRLLTHLRYAGFVFNPVSFYYCFPKDLNDREPEVVVAEVDNTPWGERHLYVLPRSAAEVSNRGSAREFVWEFDKAFHVSPFMPMDQRYSWRFQSPGEQLRVSMTNQERTPTAQPGRRCFSAHLALERRPLTARTAWTALGSFPFMTGKVFAAIYWNALRLWLKGVPFHSHPRGNIQPQEHPTPTPAEESRHEPEPAVV
ncbi:MAG: DUF1365 domain-containing protein [Polyangiaceae bacterium]